MFKSIKLAILILTISFAASGQPSDDPYMFVKDVASATFAKMKQDQKLIESDPQALGKIVEQQLLPHVDHVYAALSVLGTQAKDIPREKLVLYFEEFRIYLLSTYSNALSSYTDQIVEFEPSRPTENKKTVPVKAVIKEAGKPDISITFQVRRNKEGEWKAFDLIAEGISMVQSKRAEFAPIIRQQGIDAVINFMREKSTKPPKNAK
ncbi:ABC transporter substrate-binding protein [uncultured Paraglaciecola sp.]|uniref:MlaC/ttg2D family ABC transporter substrate-binding protein n=1 Tax=uncultured Paraglaciecola sp. TaxID=1765024 RepID=UPI0030DA2E6A|tara:strand:+ start:57799 stop:58419 length:621 start_codon:yes stop_codon:yes gene_type:complete